MKKLVLLLALCAPALASAEEATELLRAQQAHDQALKDYGRAREDANWADRELKEAEQDLEKAQQRLEQLRGQVEQK